MNDSTTELKERCWPRSPLMMSRSDSAMLVIDVQEKLTPLIANHERVVDSIDRLLRAAELLGVPTFCTEQYPQGLGSTVSKLAAHFSATSEKQLFSCRECEPLIENLRDQGRDKVLLTGIETHVCVQQTALDFLAIGFDVWIAVDAVGSRFEQDASVALRRMEMAGITLTTTEAVLFEWCEVAGTEQFKKISQLVRERS